MDDNNRIAILIPIKNMANRFKEVFKSVLAQSYKNWHIYLMDCKESIEDVKGMVDEINKGGDFISYFKQEGDGDAGASLRELYEKIKDIPYDYYCFLCADDFWHPEKLEIQLRCAKELEGPFLLTGGHSKANGFTFWDISEKQFRFYIKEPFICKPLAVTKIKGCHGQHFSNYFFNKKCIEKKWDISNCGIICNEYDMMIDWEFLINCWDSDIPVLKVPYVLTYWTMDLGNMSRWSSTDRNRYNDQVKEVKEKEFQ